MVWPLADRIKNLIEKKWPGLSDSGMASGGLRLLKYRFKNELKNFQEILVKIFENIKQNILKNILFMHA